MTAAPTLVPAGSDDLEALLPLVRAYHAFEAVTMTEDVRRAALAPLLMPESSYGCIYLINLKSDCIGYAALCFGYSIEFAGRDAFVDELFLIEAARGRGIGGQVLELLKTEARRRGIAALHLEVARDNDRARRLYGAAGFEARTRFHLMSVRL